MTQGSQVPPSGNGGSELAEPKAQKGPEAVRPKHERRVSRDGGEMRKLTASPAHPDSARSVSSKSESETPKGRDALRPRHERRLSRDESDSRKSADSPLRPVSVGVRATVDSPLHRHSGINNSDSPKRVTRHSLGSDRSIEPSPLHPYHQARLGNKSSAVSSPSSERKGASEGSHGLAPLTPGRSRLRSVTRGDETPDDSPTVPKFGDWDDKDPASAEGFTHIFERVREEKYSGAGKVPVMATETSYTNGQKRYGNDSPKGCGCFPWGRK